MVAAEERGARLDRVLAAHLAELSRSRLKALILAGRVAIGGAHDPRSRLSRQRRRPQSRSTVPAPRRTPKSAAENIPLDIVYEDDELIVIDKPAGLVVHPAAGNWSGTLVNALIAHCGDSPLRHRRREAPRHRAPPRQGHHRAAGGGQDRPRPPCARRAVRRPRPHRAAAARLPRFRLGRAGPPPRHHRRSRSAAIPMRATRWRCVQTAATAITHWQVLERYRGIDGKPVASLLACRLETGRTHQIRVHLAPSAIRSWAMRSMVRASRPRRTSCSPAAQDALGALGRQALHAYLLAIEHPRGWQRAGVPIGTAGRHCRVYSTASVIRAR